MVRPFVRQENERYKHNWKSERAKVVLGLGLKFETQGLDVGSLQK